MEKLSQNYIKIGPKIKAFRRQIGMQANKLAQQIGISPSYLNLIESGKRKIDGDLLLKVCEVLKIDLSDLTNKSDLKLREVFANDMEILAKEFGAEILNVMGFDVLGFINRVLDPAEKKVDEVATLKRKQKVAKKLNITLEELSKRKEGKGLTVYKKGVKGDFYNKLQEIKSKLLNTKANFPDGFDIEIFSFKVLKKSPF